MRGLRERLEIFDGVKIQDMSGLRLELGDAIELAELLTFLTDWLSGSQQQPLADSLAAYVGHDRYNIDELRNDLHRFVFLLGLSAGDQLFGEPTP